MCLTKPEYRRGGANVTVTVGGLVRVVITVPCGGPHSQPDIFIPPRKLLAALRVEAERIEAVKRRAKAASKLTRGRTVWGKRTLVLRRK
jgi:hypothetical protein